MKHNNYKAFLNNLKPNTPVCVIFSDSLIIYKSHVFKTTKKHIYVADPGTANVLKFNRSGTKLQADQFFALLIPMTHSLEFLFKQRDMVDFFDFFQLSLGDTEYSCKTFKERELITRRFFKEM